MTNELGEPSFPKKVEIAGFTYPSRQRCTLSWGFHIVRGYIVRGNNRSRPRLDS